MIDTSTSGCTFENNFDIKFKVGDKFKLNLNSVTVNDLRKFNLYVNDTDIETKILNILPERESYYIRFDNYFDCHFITFNNFEKYFIPIESSNNFKLYKYIPLNQDN